MADDLGNNTITTKEKSLHSTLNNMFIYFKRFRFILLYSLLKKINPKCVAKVAYKTADKVELDNLRVIGDDISLSYHYEPTPYPLISWAFSALPKGLRNWTFVDIGCGKGRVVIEAAKLPFKKVIGIEFSKELYEQARLNIVDISKIECKANQVVIINENVTKFSMPSNNYVLYLFNPIKSGAMLQLINNVVTSDSFLKQKVLILYLNPTEKHLITNMRQFKECKINPLNALYFGLFSPFKFSVFSNY